VHAAVVTIIIYARRFHTPAQPSPQYYTYSKCGVTCIGARRNVLFVNIIILLLHYGTCTTIIKKLVKRSQAYDGAHAGEPFQSLRRFFVNIRYGSSSLSYVLDARIDYRNLYL